MDLSIVIPALNEASNISQLIPDLARVAEELNLSFEIIVMDGGSVDGTPRLAKQSHSSVRVLRQHGPGYGQALAEGFAEAKGDFVLTMDADFSHDPGFIRDFWNARNQAEMLIGSRYVPGGRAQMPVARNILSRILNTFFRRGLSVPWHDLSSGFRMYRAGTLRKLSLRSFDFDALQEILIKTHAAGYKIEEIPIHYSPRKSGSSHAKLIRFGIAYLKTFWRMWRLRNSIASADYDDRAHDSIIPLQRYWQRRRKSIIEEFSPTQGRILDVGCGSSKILQVPGKLLVGLDVQLNKLRYARRFGRPLVNGSIWSLPFADESFDTVICSEVIEHIAAGREPFLELRRVLRPGGTLIIGTPDYDHFTWRFLEGMYKIVVPGGYADEHITHYTLDSLTELLTDLGFTVQRVAYIVRSEMILLCTYAVSDVVRPPVPEQQVRAGS